MDFVSTCLVDEKIPVAYINQITFKSLSRQLSMTTGEAKQVLESYLVKNKLDPECVVVVVQNENRFQLTLLSKAENYDYVYALSPCPVNNSDSIQISDLNIGPMPKRLQTIVAPQIVYTNSSLKPREPVEIFKMLDSGLKQSQSLNVPAAKESIKDSKPIKSSPVRKAQKSTDLGTKKAKPTKTSKKPEGKPISVKWTSKEKPNPHIEDKIEPEIEEEPEKEAKQQVKAPVAKTKAQLEQEEQIRNLFDEQDQQQQDVVAPPTKDESEALQPPQLEQSEPTTGARKRVRKKRRVMKKQTALEGKYMVTKDVEVSESYSEDEQPIVQFNPKAKKSKVVQKSLKSFFQKK